MAPNPYTDTIVTRLAGGKVRVDTPGGRAIYDCTRQDQFGRFPLVLGDSNAERRAAVDAFVATLNCETFVGFHDEGDPDVAPVAVDCGAPAVILLDGGSETMPVCDAHHHQHHDSGAAR